MQVISRTIDSFTLICTLPDIHTLTSILVWKYRLLSEQCLLCHILDVRSPQLLFFHTNNHNPPEGPTLSHRWVSWIPGSCFHFSVRIWEGGEEQRVGESSERNARAGLNEKKETCLISVFCKILQMYSIVQKRSLSTSPSSKINNVKSQGTQACFFTGAALQYCSWRFLSHHQAPISCL